MKKYYFPICLLLLSFFANAQIINIPDVNFKNKLLSASPSNQIARIIINGTTSFGVIDVNGDNEIEVSEANIVYQLNIENSFIQSLEGIDYFDSLNSLSCNNNQLTNINVNDLDNLYSIDCSYNSLNNLAFENMPYLFKVECQHNQLSNLTINNCNNLYVLKCNNNNLTSFSFNKNSPNFNHNVGNLDLSHNQITSISINEFGPILSFDTLNLSYNNLTSLSNNSNSNWSNNVINSLSMQEFIGNNNLLTNLDFLNCYFYSFECKNNLLTNFNSTFFVDAKFDVSNNLFTTLDLSHQYLASLYIISINNNPNLEYINFKNGGSFYDGIFSFNLFNNPSLLYICANENDIDLIQEVLQFDENSNCQVNSYCSFEPGGTFYTINGNARFDINSNGCDSNDAIVKNTKLFITNSVVSTTIIPDTSGNYNIPVQQGSHTLTPIVENPSYFNFSPPSATINFPSQTSPFSQNFCTSFNGVHPDLEVVLVPLTNAKPGFDSVFKIVYKNKGTISLSGAVNLIFQDAYQDYVDSFPVVTSQSIDNLNWSYVSLAPFETREIIVAFNLNTPTENPPLDSGSILNYSVSINSGVTDETPLDNNFVLNQTVVNSLDPNDKTCLEGSSLPVTQVGKYVHYLIRFENNGTANAQNVVVADRIDTTKFDINSFQTISGSHPFVTRITDSNKVEFIYQNINLPFGDATNDGYVVFKIKTKPNLAINDTFSNTASIYFDYNAPIITNTASTIVASNLLVTSFNDSNVSISPNPVTDRITITAYSKINFVGIYDINGRLVQTQIGNDLQSEIDLSLYEDAIYIVKVTTKEGNSSERIVKKSK